MPPLTSAACGRTVCAPTEKKKKRAVNDLWERESPAVSRHPLFDNGGFGRRAFFRSKGCLSREHPHPPPSGAPSPLKGEGLRAAARAAPTAEDSLGTLARQTQAQTWNRAQNKFCKPRAQWPGGKLGTHSNFARRKRCTPSQECVPRNGVRGKRPMDLGGAKRSRSPSDASPGAFCLLCRHGQSRSPPAGGETPASHHITRCSCQTP